MPKSVLRLKVDKGQGLQSGILFSTIKVHINQHQSHHLPLTTHLGSQPKTTMGTDREKTMYFKYLLDESTKQYTSFVTCKFTHAGV